MEVVYYSMLVIHIAGGAGALVAGLTAILSKKGLRLHRTSGVVFYWSMLAVAVSAFALSIYKNIPFLLAISVFSFYMTYTGRRSISNKQLQPNALDWTITIITFAPAGYMVTSGNLVLTVFGFVLAGYLLPDLLHFTRVIDLSARWLVRHISRMMGSYISTVTAFFVVNVTMEPAWVVWLLPTVVFTPVIVFYIKKHQPMKALNT